MMMHKRDADDRLHSWKEIAVFLGHGVRTAQRWELERGLPVHRTPGGKLGSVFAFKHELAGWMASPGPDSPNPSAWIAPGLKSAEGEATADPRFTGATPCDEQAEAAKRVGQSMPPARRPGLASHSGWWKPLLAAALLFAAISSLFLRTSTSHKVAGGAMREHVPDPASVDLYLRGRYFWEKRDPEDLQRAVDLYTQAIVRDPQYAEPYAGLANCYNLLREFSTMPPEEAYPRAFAAASRAIQLDPNLAEAHASLAFITFYWKWDPAAADREFQSAIALKPDMAMAHHWYANTLMSRKRTDEALHEIEIAQRLDPSSTAILGSKGLILIVANRDQEGLSLLRQLEATQPDYLPPHSYLANEYLIHHQAQGFLAEENFLVARTGSPVQAALAAAASRAYASGGYDAMVRAMLDVLEKLPDGGAGRHVYMARLECLLGRPEQALQLLEVAYLNHEPDVYGLNADPPFAALHGVPEFQQMAALDWHPSAHPTSPGSDSPAIANSATPPSPAGR